MRGHRNHHPSITLCALVATAVLASACQSGDGGATGAEAAAAPAFIGPMQCTTRLPSGPPPKPEKMTAFGTATAWNVGKNMGRTAITSAGTMVAGPVGGAVAGSVAARALPSEFDIRGTWQATDGAPNCGCSLAITSPTSWSGANPPRGTLTQQGCRNSLLANVNDWRLDETMTGLEAEFLLYAANGNRIAVLKRDGPDYYSGELSNGTPVTIWRQR